MENVLFILFGLIVGFLGGYAGIGGAPFLIIFLTSFFHLSQHTAQGTILAVMLGPMSLMGILAIKERIRPNLKYAIIGVVFYAVFSYFGASLAFIVQGNAMKIVFALFIFLLGLNEVHGMFKGKVQDKESHEIPWQHIALVGLFVGVIGGFFGIGAGVLMTPIFVSGFGMSKENARALSLMILIPPVSLGAVIKYNMEGAILWDKAIIIFISYFITNYFGSKWAKSHSTVTFKKGYGYILMLVSIANILTAI